MISAGPRDPWNEPPRSLPGILESDTDSSSPRAASELAIVSTRTADGARCPQHALTPASTPSLQIISEPSLPVVYT